MAQLSPQELAALQAKIDAHPGIQEALQKYHAAGGGLVAATALGDAFNQFGIVMPHDYRFHPKTGKVERVGFVKRNPWVVPSIIVGGGLGGAAAAGAFGGAGGGAGAAGGAAGGAGAAGAGAAGAGAAGGAGATAANAAANAASGAAPNLWESLLGGGAAAGLTALLNQLNKPDDKPALSPQQQAMMDEMMGLSVDRQRRIAPIHEAAMRMAGSMAPTGGSSPRMNEALARSTRPRPQAQTSPAMLQAIQALMRR